MRSHQCSCNLITGHGKPGVALRHVEHAHRHVPIGARAIGCLVDPRELIATSGETQFQGRGRRRTHGREHRSGGACLNRRLEQVRVEIDDCYSLRLGQRRSRGGGRHVAGGAGFRASSEGQLAPRIEGWGYGQLRDGVGCGSISPRSKACMIATAVCAQKPSPYHSAKCPMSQRSATLTCEHGFRLLIGLRPAARRQLHTAGS